MDEIQSGLQYLRSGSTAPTSGRSTRYSSVNSRGTNTTTITRSRSMIMNSEQQQQSSSGLAQSMRRSTNQLKDCGYPNCDGCSVHASKPVSSKSTKMSSAIKKLGLSHTASGSVNNVSSGNNNNNLHQANTSSSNSNSSNPFYFSTIENNRSSPMEFVHSSVPTNTTPSFGGNSSSNKRLRMMSQNQQQLYNNNASSSNSMVGIMEPLNLAVAPISHHNQTGMSDSTSMLLGSSALLMSPTKLYQQNQLNEQLMSAAAAASANYFGQQTGASKMMSSGNSNPSSIGGRMNYGVANSFPGIQQQQQRMASSSINNSSSGGLPNNSNSLNAFVNSAIAAARFPKECPPIPVNKSSGSDSGVCSENDSDVSPSMAPFSSQATSNNNSSVNTANSRRSVISQDFSGLSKKILLGV